MLAENFHSLDTENASTDLLLSEMVKLYSGGKFQNSRNRYQKPDTKPIMYFKFKTQKAKEAILGFGTRL